MTFTGLLLGFKSCLLPCMFTGLSVSCKRSELKKLRLRDSRVQPTDVTVPPRQNFMLLKPKAYKYFLSGPILGEGLL